MKEKKLVERLFTNLEILNYKNAKLTAFNLITLALSDKSMSSGARLSRFESQ